MQNFEIFSWHFNASRNSEKEKEDIFHYIRGEQSTSRAYKSVLLFLICVILIFLSVSSNLTRLKQNKRDFYLLMFHLCVC